MNTRRTIFLLLSLMAVLALALAACGGGGGGQENAGTGTNGSDIASIKGNDELAKEMAMACFLYDTNGVAQADGILVGSWFVGGDDPSTRYKDLLIEIRPHEVSRAERANGWVYQAYASVNFLYANLDGGRWNDGEKFYTIYVSTNGEAWENVEVIGRRCGLPEPPKPTTKAEAITARIANNVSASLTNQYLMEEYDRYVVVVNLVNQSEETWDICVSALAAVYDKKRTGHPDAIWQGSSTDCYEEYTSLPPGERQVEIFMGGWNYFTPNVVGPNPFFRQLCVFLVPVGGDKVEAFKLSQEDKCSNSAFDYE